jgi:hypothetical protein
MLLRYKIMGIIPFQVFVGHLRKANVKVMLREKTSPDYMQTRIFPK